MMRQLRIFRRAFLVRCRTSIYSQYGEDAVISHLNLPDKGFFVDVGCWHPKKFSNTWQLYQKGWRGVNVDLGEVKIQTFNWVRKKDHNVVAAVSDQLGTVMVQRDKDFSVGEQIVLPGQTPRAGFGQTRVMQSQTLNEILKQSPFADQPIDLLSIDAEGHDIHVLNSLNLDRYIPRVILVESYVPHLTELLTAPLHLLLKEKGYELFNWVGPTLFYAHPARIDLTR